MAKINKKTGAEGHGQTSGNDILLHVSVKLLYTL